MLWKTFAALLVLVGLVVSAAPLLFPLLLYPSWSLGAAPAPLPGAEAVRIGGRLAFYIPAKTGQPTLVVAHGNGHSASDFTLSFAGLVAQGYGLLALEYPGYGGEPGSASEAQIRLESDQALAWLAASQSVPPEDTVLVGLSLGSAVVMQAAGEKPWRAVVLLAPMDSVERIVAWRLPLLPAAWVTRGNSWRSDQQIGRLNAPLLVIVAGQDATIPNRFSQALFAAAPSPKQWVQLEGAGHRDLFARGAAAVIEGFITAL